jgi:hypothetical protein
MPFWLVYMKTYGIDFLTPSFETYINKHDHHQKDSLVGQLIGAEFRDGSPSSLRAFGNALRNPNTLLLMIQYGACFGVELTMYNATATYFFQEFKLNQVSM